MNKNNEKMEKMDRKYNFSEFLKDVPVIEEDEELNC